MNDMQRYLAEEVAEDHADGIISRREAMRRLGLLGLTGAAATGLLTTFAAAEAAGAPDLGAAGSAQETVWAPVAREAITFDGPQSPLLAAWAPAAQPRGGVLVIHENRGLNEHIRTVAGRFAASGFSALALDLLSEEGGTGTFPDEAAVAAALAQIPPERFVADMKAALTELERRIPNGLKLSAIGFCFGGGMIWRLLTSNEPRLAAGAPFYGPFPDGGSFEGSRAAVLGVYGGLDSRILATKPAAKAALDASQQKYELLTFAEADHAFFNETGARFNPLAATEAWRRTLNWFDNSADRHGD